MYLSNETNLIKNIVNATHKKKEAPAPKTFNELKIIYIFCCNFVVRGKINEWTCKWFGNCNVWHKTISKNTCWKNKNSPSSRLFHCFYFEVKLITRIERRTVFTCWQIKVEGKSELKYTIHN